LGPGKVAASERLMENHPQKVARIVHDGLGMGNERAVHLGTIIVDDADAWLRGL
jgi:hypothetical protein